MRMVCAAAATAALLLGGFAAPAAAQDGLSLQAVIGPSFGSVGPTVLAGGTAGVALNDRVSLVGELGVIPRASHDRATEIASPLPGVSPATDAHVNGYHLNANLRFTPWQPAHARFQPYITGGIGTFVAETVASGSVGGAVVTERRREFDLATNAGAGVTFRLADWIGLTGDYRTFFIHRDDIRQVHRFATGVTFFLR